MSDGVIHTKKVKEEGKSNRSGKSKKSKKCEKKSLSDAGLKDSIVLFPLTL